MTSLISKLDDILTQLHCSTRFTYEAIQQNVNENAGTLIGQFCLNYDVVTTRSLGCLAILSDVNNILYRHKTGFQSENSFRIANAVHQP